MIAGIICILAVIGIMAIHYVLDSGKSNGRDSETCTASTDTTGIVEESPEIVYVNDVKGHIEKDTIVGNFTGADIDTLYVCTEFNEKEEVLPSGLNIMPSLTIPLCRKLSFMEPVRLHWFTKAMWTVTVRMNGAICIQRI